MTPRSWFSITNKSDTLAEVSIYEEIGLWGITAKDFIDSLRAVGDRKILLRINSPGGDVFHGSAIYTRLRDHKGGVEVKIDGLAASMASVIAMAGQPVSMPENALMMIHNPSGMVIGESEDMRKLADVLDKVKDTLITAYERKTGKPRAELARMLDDETWMTAQEALDHGFIDQIDAPLAAAATLRPDQLARFAKAPRALTTLAPRMNADPDPQQDPAPNPTPAPDPDPAPTPTPDEADPATPAPPVEPQLDPAAEAEVAEVLNRVSSLNTDLIAAHARVTDLTNLLEAREAKIAELTAQVTKLNKVQDLYEKLKGSLNLRPAAIVPEINPAADISQSSDQALVAKFNASTPEQQLAMLRDPALRMRLLANIGTEAPAQS